MCVFNRRRKIGSDGAVATSSGSSFHIRDPETSRSGHRLRNAWRSGPPSNWCFVEPWARRLGRSAAREKRSTIRRCHAMCYSSPYLHGLCVQDHLMQYCQDAVIQVETARTASGTTACTTEKNHPVSSTHGASWSYTRESLRVWMRTPQSSACTLRGYSIIGSGSGFTMNPNPKWIRLRIQIRIQIQWMWTEIHFESGSGSDNRIAPIMHDRLIPSKSCRVTQERHSHASTDNQEVSVSPDNNHQTKHLCRHAGSSWHYLGQVQGHRMARSSAMDAVDEWKAKMKCRN